MKRPLRLFAAAGLAVWLTARPGSAEDFSGRLKTCTALALSISPEAPTERAACESMLAQGLAAGWWSEEEQRVAADWLSYIFDPAQDAAPANPERFPRDVAWRELVRRATLPTDPEAPTQPVFSWLRARFAALDAARNDALRLQLRTAIEQAEDTWLSAKNPADLDRAVQGLTDTKAVLGFRWDEVRGRGFPDSAFGGDFRPASFRSPPGLPLAADDLRELYDCWGILACPEPLILPDPVAEPAKFAKVRRDWSLLLRGPQRFLKRPAIARLFAEWDDRFRAEFAEVQRTLNAAILREAPAAEFEREFNRLKSHVLAPLNPRGGPLFPTGQVRPDAAPDYHASLANAQRIPQGGPPGAAQMELKWRGDFAGWLEWRQAGEAGNGERMEKARRTLFAKLHEFDPQVAVYLGKRLAPSARPAAQKTGTPVAKKVAPQDPATAELVAALRRRFPEENSARSLHDVFDLVDAWIGFDKGDVPAAPPRLAFAATWQQIAAGADGTALVTLRDRAARGALARMLPEQPVAEGIPLTLLFRRALETAIARESRDLTAQIFALDAIASILPESERGAWMQTLDRFKMANREMSLSSSGARSMWIEVLKTTDSPAAAALAVEKIKASWK